jgi:hypothetical protein
MGCALPVRRLAARNTGSNRRLTAASSLGVGAVGNRRDPAAYASTTCQEGH